MNVAKYQIIITQNRTIISNKFEAKGMIYSSDIEVFGVDNYKEGERVVNDLC